MYTVRAMFVGKSSRAQCQMIRHGPAPAIVEIQDIMSRTIELLGYVKPEDGEWYLEGSTVGEIREKTGPKVAQEAWRRWLIQNPNYPPPMRSGFNPHIPERPESEDD